MYTSYFACPKLKNIDSPNRLVAISKGLPYWKTDLRSYPSLAPSWDLVKNRKIHPDEYTKIYRETVLDKLSAKYVYDHISSVFGENAILLCYEKPDQFCHRFLVAEWFMEELQIWVPEY
jgi:hypothetical protein